MEFLAQQDASFSSIPSIVSSLRVVLKTGRFSKVYQEVLEMVFTALALKTTRTDVPP
jgi:hypothetical protein